MNIENNILEINKINEKMKKCNSFKYNIEFINYEDDLKNIIEIIKLFGKLCNGPNSEIIDLKKFDIINSWIGGEHIFNLLYNALVLIFFIKNVIIFQELT